MSAKGSKIVKPENLNWPIPPTGINPAYNPVKVEVIYWYNLDINTGTSIIDKTYSNCYSMADVNTYFSQDTGYPPIYNLAVAAAVPGALAATPMTPLGLPTNPDPMPQPWDFAIDQSCYIVFVLEPSAINWTFQPYAAALDFKYSEEGYYDALWHVSQYGPTATAWPGCTVCYFSGYVSTQLAWGSDPFTMYYQFLVGTILQQVSFDPAIKNKGHPPALDWRTRRGLSYKAQSRDPAEIHVPTPFEITKYSPEAAARTRAILKSHAEKQAECEEALRRTLR